MLPDLPADVDRLGVALLLLDRSRWNQAISRYACDTVEAAHPDHARLRSEAQVAPAHALAARQDHRAASASLTRHLDRLGSDLAYTPDPAARLTETNQGITDLTDHLAQAHERVGALRLEPAIRTLPPARLQVERETWQAERARASEATHQTQWTLDPPETRKSRARREADRYLTPDRPRSPGQGRGPGIGW